MMSDNKRLLIFVFFFVLMLGFSQRLESSMALHMGLQIPLLVVLGGFFISVLIKFYPRLTAIGKQYRTSLFLFAFFSIGIWMLPRMLDAALHQYHFAIIKWMTLFIAGSALVLCWKHLPFILRGLLHIELLATLLRLGWLYLIAPQRYCVSYLIDDQIILGYLLLSYAVIYGFWLAFNIMFVKHTLADTVS